MMPEGSKEEILLIKVQVQYWVVGFFIWNGGFLRYRATLLPPFPFLYTNSTFNLGVKHDILAALSYFDVFDYPITQMEISQFLKNSYEQKDINEGIRELLMESWIYKFDDLYCLHDDFNLVIRRHKGNQKARQMLKTAEKIASFLSYFPFVRGVAVSGSLSKNFADENSDIDFFIITAKNKLWTARGLMHLFRKLTIPFKKQHWFCMNYFIDETSLEIKEKNLYTAVEVATLLPLRGIEAFQSFYQKNKWTREFLPNHTMRISYVKDNRRTLLKNSLEFILKTPLQNLVEYFLMKLTKYRLGIAKKENRVTSRGFPVRMDLSKHFAKQDPRDLQATLLQEYERKIVQILFNYENKYKSSY